MVDRATSKGQLVTWEPLGTGVPAEYLGACLLLLLAEQSAHGYQLCEQVHELGIEVDSGTVYRRLRAMEDDGVVTSHWELSGSGPPRRQYVATGDGLRQLAACHESVRRVVDHLVDYAERCARLPEPPPGSVTPSG